MQIKDKDFVRLHQYIKSNFGVNLEKKRTLIEGRLSNYIISEGFDGFHDYLEDVFSDRTGNKINTLMTKLTTNYTYFMREKEHYSFMEKVALPEWVDKIKDHDLRIWSSACASGEEAYTTVMVLQEWFGPTRIKQWDAGVLATDISVKVLEMAKEGIYPEEHFEQLPQEWKRKYFDKVGEGRYKIKPVLRNNVNFGQFNLMGQFNRFRRKFHIIFSRNVMIYFDTPTKQALAKRYHDALEVGGYLFIGHSESLGGIQGDFLQIQPAIYKRVK